MYEFSSRFIRSVFAILHNFCIGDVRKIFVEYEISRVSLKYSVSYRNSVSVMLGLTSEDIRSRMGPCSAFGGLRNSRIDRFFFNPHLTQPPGFLAFLVFN